MNVKERYEAFSNAYKSGNEGLFVNAGIAWLQDEPNNPYSDGTKEHALFFEAKRYYMKWQRKGIDNRFSKRMMIEKLKELAELNVNPYINAGFRMLGVMPEEVKLEVEPETIHGTTVSENSKEEEIVDKITAVPEGVYASTEEIVEALEKIDDSPTIAEIKEEIKEQKHVLGVLPEEKPKLFNRRKKR